MAEGPSKEVLKRQEELRKRSGTPDRNAGPPKEAKPTLRERFSRNAGTGGSPKEPVQEFNDKNTNKSTGKSHGPDRPGAKGRADALKRQTAGFLKQGGKNLAKKGGGIIAKKVIAPVAAAEGVVMAGQAAEGVSNLARDWMFPEDKEYQDPRRVFDVPALGFGTGTGNNALTGDSDINEYDAAKTIQDSFGLFSPSKLQLDQIRSNDIPGLQDSLASEDAGRLGLSRRLISRAAQRTGMAEDDLSAAMQYARDLIQEDAQNPDSTRSPVQVAQYLRENLGPERSAALAEIYNDERLTTQRKGAIDTDFLNELRGGSAGFSSTTAAPETPETLERGDAPNIAGGYRSAAGAASYNPTYGQDGKTVLEPLDVADTAPRASNGMTMSDLKFHRTNMGEEQFGKYIRELDPSAAAPPATPTLTPEANTFTNETLELPPAPGTNDQLSATGVPTQLNTKVGQGTYSYTDKNGKLVEGEAADLYTAPPNSTFSTGQSGQFPGTRDITALSRQALTRGNRIQKERDRARDQKIRATKAATSQWMNNIDPGGNLRRRAQRGNTEAAKILNYRMARAPKIDDFVSSQTDAYDADISSLRETTDIEKLQDNQDLRNIQDRKNEIDTEGNELEREQIGVNQFNANTSRFEAGTKEREHLRKVLENQEQARENRRKSNREYGSKSRTRVNKFADDQYQVFGGENPNALKADASRFGVDEWLRDPETGGKASETVRSRVINETATVGQFIRGISDMQGGNEVDFLGQYNQFQGLTRAQKKDRGIKENQFLPNSDQVSPMQVMNTLLTSGDVQFGDVLSKEGFFSDEVGRFTSAMLAQLPMIGGFFDAVGIDRVTVKTKHGQEMFAEQIGRTPELQQALIDWVKQQEESGGMTNRGSRLD